MLTNVSNRLPAIAAVISVSLLATAIASAGKPAGASYSIISFAPPGVATSGSTVADVNEHGDVVGAVSVDVESAQATHLDLATGTYTPLRQDADVTSGGALSVNNLGQIVGVFDAQMPRAIFWATPESAPLHLPPLPGDLGAKALAINDDGFVVGISSWGGNGCLPVVWRVTVDKTGVTVDGPVPLFPLPGDATSSAASVETLIDGTVQVVGESAYSGNTEAVVWTLSFNADGTLAGGGTPVSLGESGTSATGINDLGEVSGSIDPQPAFAASGGLLEPLPIPKGVYEADGIAEALNNNGDLVGYLDIYTSKRNVSYKTLAYLWKDGTPIDLNTQIGSHTGWSQLKYANNISDGGIIVGVGSYDVAYRGFVMVPNP